MDSEVQDEWELQPWMEPYIRLLRWHQGHHPESVMNDEVENFAKWRTTAVKSQLQLLEDLHAAGWLRKRRLRNR